MAEGTATETVAVGNASSIPPDDVLVVEDESPESLYAAMEEHGWGDGLPVVFPTEARVEQMLAGYPRSVDEMLAVLPPRSGAATVKTVAVNAVMAGCPPEVFPVIVAAVRALGESRLNLQSIQATTHSVAIMVAVHGQIVERAGYNAGIGTFGPGWRANATTGRAIRFVLLHVAGGRPGDGDASTQGQPAKYGLCFAENAAASPWPIFPRSLGIDAPSAVTVAGTEGPHNSHDMWSTHPEPILKKMASVMCTLGSNHAPMPSSEFFCVLCPEHAAQAAAEGWSRRDVQLFLFEHARLPWRVWAEHFAWRFQSTPWAAGNTDPDRLMPIMDSPDAIKVLVAGGPGKHSCVIPSFLGICPSVTVPVETW
jgi:hypothetical protein